MLRESREKSFTINLRQKKAEIKQLLAPFTRPLSRGRNKWKEKKSDLLYVISDGDYDSAFKLDTLTGELFVDGPLDREKTSDYLLNITVQDQGSPRPKFVSKLLHVSLYMIAKNCTFLL